MRCPVLLLLVCRVAWGTSSGNAAENARQTPGAPDLLQSDSPRKVSHHTDPDHDSDPVAQAAPSILDIFPQDLLTSRLIMMIYSLSPETDDCFLTHLRSRIKPLDIRRIEHDHFIDYEVGLVVDLVAAEMAFFPKVTFFPGRVR